MGFYPYAPGTERTIEQCRVAGHSPVDQGIPASSSNPGLKLHGRPKALLHNPLNCGFWNPDRTQRWPDRIDPTLENHPADGRLFEPKSFGHLAHR